MSDWFVFLFIDSGDMAGKPPTDRGLCPKETACVFPPSYPHRAPKGYIAGVEFVNTSRGMEWLPKPRIYGGENEYSIWPHKPDSVGATPTPATTKRPQ